MTQITNENKLYIDNIKKTVFDDFINIKNFDSNNIKMDEKSYKIFFFNILDM